MPVLSYELDTSALVELLQQSAVKHLTTSRQLSAHHLRTVLGTVTTDLDALYAYKCGEYERCLQLSTHNVLTPISFAGMLSVFAYPELIQLMDDDIVSLIGLVMIVNPSFRDDVTSSSE